MSRENLHKIVQKTSINDLKTSLGITIKILAHKSKIHPLKI